jgi:hypothetical protein
MESDIKESNLGLDFISKLRPVSITARMMKVKNVNMDSSPGLEEALNTSGASR